MSLPGVSSSLYGQSCTRQSLWATSPSGDLSIAGINRKWLANCLADIPVNKQKIFLVYISITGLQGAKLRGEKKILPENIALLSHVAGFRYSK